MFSLLFDSWAAKGHRLRSRGVTIVVITKNRIFLRERIRMSPKRHDSIFLDVRFRNFCALLPKLPSYPHSYACVRERVTLDCIFWNASCSRLFVRCELDPARDEGQRLSMGRGNGKENLCAFRSRDFPLQAGSRFLAVWFAWQLQINFCGRPLIKSGLRNLWWYPKVTVAHFNLTVVIARRHKRQGWQNMREMRSGRNVTST